MISLWLLRQVEYPNSRARPIFVLEVTVPLHQYAAFSVEFILDSEPAIIFSAACYHCRRDLPFLQRTRHE
jgi:hypothetical protein